MKLNKNEETVILVDGNDNEIGTIGKMEAHRLGRLHRAFSIFVFNTRGELLLQRRALSKYHSGGLWSNTCCGHPRIGEKMVDAARRRLREEMGIDCKLEEVFSFLYSVKFSHDLFEHEYDHVIIGKYNAPPDANPEEASEWKWSQMYHLKQDMHTHPDNYTYWLRNSLERVISHVATKL